MDRERKVIIIGMPSSFSFYKVVKERIEQLDYQVIDISFQDHDFKYKNIWDRLFNLYRKIFLKDRTYKNLLKFKANGNHVFRLLENIKGRTDYALIIRPDIFPEIILEKILEKTNKMIGYQWDGMKRYPAVDKTVKYFDKFYVFDEQDTYNFNRYLPLTNFYFSHLNQKDKAIKKNTFFFLGSFFVDRWDAINDTAKLILDCGGEPNFLLFGPPNVALQDSTTGIKFIETHIPYKEYIDMVLESEVLVDFLVDIHGGLSFRIFEAVGYEKKLITNNANVRNYDFYHPNNIFILGQEKRTLKDFMQVKYHTLPEDIVKKYDFDNWLLKVLG